MVAASDTLVFLPAWNEEENLPAVLDEVHRELPAADVLVVDDGSTDGTADVAREHSAEVVSFAANRGLRPASQRGTPMRRSTDTRSACAWTPTASIPWRSSFACWSACGPASATSRSARGSPVATALRPYRYKPSGPRRLGTALLRRSMAVALGRPFYDATSGMYAVNAKAMEVLARPYTTEAPEVEALLRLGEAGLRVDEVPVDMRPRAGGESKLRGKKALLVVVTIVGTLLATRRWWKRR